MVRFGHGRQGVEGCRIEPPVADSRIEGHVTDPERGEVLEEVGSLRRVHAEIFETALGNHPSLGNLRPQDRNAEPRVARPPAPGPHQYIISPLLLHLQVERLYLAGHLRRLGPFEPPRLHVNHILQPLDTPQSQRRFGIEQRPVGLSLGRRPVHTAVLHRLGNGSYLEKVEYLFVAVRHIHIHRKLDFNG